MILDTNQEGSVAPETTEGEGGQEQKDDVVTLNRKDYESLNQTLGSLKRELKDLRKASEKPQETPEKTESDQSNLVQKTFLRAAGITDKEEIDLALSTAKKWGVGIDELVDDEDFKSKLEKLRTQKANLEATSNVKGDKGGSSAKSTPEYWIAKGTPPTADQVPDRKARAAIARAFMKNSATGGKVFYND